MLLVISYSPQIKLLLMFWDIKTFLYFFKQAAFYNSNGKIRLSFSHLYFQNFLCVVGPQNAVSGPAALADPWNLY